MILIALALLCVLSVPLAGGRLSRIGELNLRWLWIAPAALVKVLGLAATQARIRPMLAGLPVAGFSGTLQGGESVFAGIDGSALGAVRAKTGNLSTVTTLAGLVTDKAGRTLAFAFMADRIPAAGMLKTAANAIDEAAAALANCGCRLRALAAARTVGL